MINMSKIITKFTIIYILYAIMVNSSQRAASECGCKTTRKCYKDMLEELLDRDEVPCIEDAAIGLSTVTVFLKALKQYCSEVFDVFTEHMSFEGKTLYEVHLANLAPAKRKNSGRQKEEKPIFIIEAGQEAGSESVMLALYVIEQLVACEENDQMLQNVRWIILPCSNPDGQEFARFSKLQWKKNLNPSATDASYGVDLTRNFNSHWDECPKVESGFSQIFPGSSPASEKETIFLQNLLNKHKNNAKMYLSIKRDGHSINYPYAYKQDNPHNISLISKIAGEVSARVNQRAAGIHFFLNNSIFEAEGKAHCGHSVDYAYDLGINLSFEMRVFLGSDNHIVSQFQTLPRGYESSLRNGYFSGIKELYNALTNEKKYGKIT